MKPVDPFVTSDRELTHGLLRRFGPEIPSGALEDIVLVLVKAVREDHVALDLTRPETRASSGAPDEVLATLARAPSLCAFIAREDEVATTGPPIIVVDERFIYLRRLCGAERRVADAIDHARTAALLPPRDVTSGEVDRALGIVHAQLARDGLHSEELGDVVTRMLTRPVSFVTGGPGTGKTWVVTQALRVLDVALSARPSAPTRPVTFAVAAPTAKAARRLAHTLDRNMGGEPFATLIRDNEREGSLHRLLGLRPDRLVRPAPLTHDVVVIDEVSMVDLPMLDLLLQSALGDPARTTRVVLVGDPHQLASVNVGAVLADAVDPDAHTGDLITSLVEVRRTGSRTLIDLAHSINTGDGERVAGLLRSPAEDLGHVVTSEDADLMRLVTGHAIELATLADRGDVAGALATLGSLSVLCANREGPGSVAWWNARVGSSVRQIFPGRPGQRFSVGEPVLVTRNQRTIGVNNGDVGVVVNEEGHHVIAFDADLRLPVGAVGFAESAWAMTIHKSQGSEYDHVVVVLPGVGSPLLTRELFYTGVTRARRAVTIVGEPDAIQQAVSQEVSRVSGLTHRLR